MGSTGSSKSWRNVSAEQLVEGDVVGGQGMIVRVQHDGANVQVWAGEKQSPVLYREGSPVWAFH